MKPWIEYYPGFMHLMGDNGWVWKCDPDNKDYERYRCSFLNEWDHVVDAIVYERNDQIGFSGEYGIECLEWIECQGWDRSDIGFSIYDLEEMRNVLEIAEENLVRCGVPFFTYYEFHGKNKANMKRRNDATRKRLNMARWEQEALKDRNGSND